MAELDLRKLQEDVCWERHKAKQLVTRVHDLETEQAYKAKELYEIALSPETPLEIGSQILGVIGPP